MVHCVKCGVKNPDGAEFCAKCGKRLYSSLENRQYKRMEDECFGIPRGGKIFAMIIGVILILWGVSSIVEDVYGIDVPWWPLIVIVFGIFVIITAVRGKRYW